MATAVGKPAIAGVTTPIKGFGETGRNKENYNGEKKEVKKPKKEKPSAYCQTPPSLIKNKIQNREYTRGLCLGEGGFARCFQLKDNGGKVYAAKTIAKCTLKNTKTKQKLLHEIHVHRSLEHLNIVQFVDCFEDNVNVYMLLEMCPNGSLMDMVKARKSLTEPEAKFYTMQLLGAVSYLHDRRVVHRDLKLGNIFIDENMNAKVGDFGLAAILPTDGDRRYTICGTPNYIAPEIIGDTKSSGHGFEVDVWCLGVILYAMLFGKTPFQCSSIEAIYEKIKRNDFHIPRKEGVDAKAGDLITCILNPDPKSRPSVTDVAQHAFFRYDFPDSIPMHCLTTTPEFDISLSESMENMISVAKEAGFDIKMKPTASNVRGGFATRNISSSSSSSSSSSGSSHFTVFNPNEGMSHSDRVMIVKNQHSNMEPVRVRTANLDMSSGVLPTSLSPASTKEKYRPIDPAKAFRLKRTTAGLKKSVPMEEASGEPSQIVDGRRIEKAGQRKLRNIAETTDARVLSLYDEYCISRDITPSVRHTWELKLTWSEMARALTSIDKRVNSEDLKRLHSRMMVQHEDLTPSLYVTKWVDFTNKYGVGIELSNGASIILYQEQSRVLYMSDKGPTDVYESVMSENEAWETIPIKYAYRTEEQDQEIKKLQGFREYMTHNLSSSDDGYRQMIGGKVKQGKPRDGSNKPRNNSGDKVFVKSFCKESGYTRFQFSDGSLQYNFDDHNKIVLSSNGQQVDILDSERMVHSFSMKHSALICRTPLPGGNRENGLNSISPAELRKKVYFIVNDIYQQWKVRIRAEDVEFPLV